MEVVWNHLAYLRVQLTIIIYVMYGIHIRWETGDIYTRHIFNDYCWAIIESPTSCFWLFIASIGCLLTGERVRGHWRRNEIVTYMCRLME